MSMSSSHVANGKLSGSLLSREYKYALPMFLIAYVLLEAFVGLESYYSSEPICNDKHDIGDFPWLVNLCIVTCFGLSFLLTCNRMLVTSGQHSSELFCSLAANLTVTAIAGSANMMTLIWNYGGLCRDSFG